MFCAKDATVIALVLYCLLRGADAARILGFFPSQSKSNLLVHCAIADALQRHGHEVTVIGTMPNVYPQANYQYIQLKVPSFDPKYLKDSARKALPLWLQQLSLMKLVTAMGSRNLAHPNMLQFMQEQHQQGFDLLILGYFINDFHLGLAAYFGCPIIVSSTMQPMYSTNTMVGNPHEIAYVPSLLTGMQQPMNYGARIWNFIISTYERTLLNLLTTSQMRTYYNYHFNCSHCATFEEVRKNISLVFVNHHFTQGPIRPNVPNIIEIGGIQIDENRTALPADIAEFMRNATAGVIFLSFGSNIECNTLPVEKSKIMYDAFARMPFKVLWKWGSCATPGESSNILYRSWFPQNDILADAGVRLFITHGGLGSVMEAQYHGVPMLGIPFFGDQPGNVRYMAGKGFGLVLDYAHMSQRSFTEAVHELMHNASYTTAIQRFATLYRDRPMTPRQTVVYWVNYVLRHKGARHMQSPAIYMHDWQRYNIDVWLSLSFGVIIAGVIFVRLIAAIIKRLQK